MLSPLPRGSIVLKEATEEGRSSLSPRLYLVTLSTRFAPAPPRRRASLPPARRARRRARFALPRRGWVGEMRARGFVRRTVRRAGSGAGRVGSRVGRGVARGREPFLLSSSALAGPRRASRTATARDARREAAREAATTMVDRAGAHTRRDDAVWRGHPRRGRWRAPLSPLVRSGPFAAASSSVCVALPSSSSSSNSSSALHARATREAPPRAAQPMPDSAARERRSGGEKRTRASTAQGRRALNRTNECANHRQSPPIARRPSEYMERSQTARHLSRMASSSSAAISCFTVMVVEQIGESQARRPPAGRAKSINNPIQPLGKTGTTKSSTDTVRWSAEQEGLWKESSAIEQRHWRFCNWTLVWRTTAEPKARLLSDARSALAVRRGSRLRLLCCLLRSDFFLFASRWRLLCCLLCSAWFAVVCCLLLLCLNCGACFAVRRCYCMTAGWGTTEVYWVLRPGAL